MAAVIAAYFTTSIAGLNPNITSNPGVGAAVPGASLINPEYASTIPANPPPIKFVTYTGTGFADTKSAFDSGSIAIEITDFKLPIFKRCKIVVFIKLEPNAVSAATAIRSEERRVGKE